MTIKERIISYLAQHPEGIDDDELTEILGLPNRVEANTCCRELARSGLVTRKPVDGKIHNFWKTNPNQTNKLTGNSISGTVRETLSLSKTAHATIGYCDSTREWFWEGNVQARVIAYLAALEYQIRSVADTASHQQGIDITAEKDGKTLWISVKGYPRGTDKTNPSVQAGTWFQGAIFNMVVYRGQNANVQLVVALPDFRRYHRLTQKVTWFKHAADFTYYWVDAVGNITVE